MIGRWIAHWAQHRPDHPAIVFDDRTLTYSELDARIVEVTQALLTQGIRPGDRLVYLGPNAPEFICSFAACLRVGAAFVPLNGRLTVDEHRYQTGNCTPAIAVADPASVDHLQTACPPDTIVLSTEELEAATSHNDSELPPVPSDDADALLVYTSGTTGRPKGAVHTHRSFHYTILNGVACQDLTAADVAMSFLPLFHVGGLNIQTLPTLYAGGTVVLHDRFDPTRALNDIAKHRVTVSTFVPATIRAIIAEPDFSTADLSSVRGIVTGSSIVPDDLLGAFEARGLNPGQVYGSTETGPTSVVLRFDDSSQIGSAGRPALHSEARVESGELQIRGPHLFDRYWQNGEATAAAFDGDWYRTGDLAHVDNDGWIWIDGRVDDAIISGGENIDPEEVEAVLAEHPAVSDVAVVAGPSPQWGQTPVAFVVAKDNAKPNLADLRAHAEERLARFKLPTDLRVVDELPKTALGKVQKFELRAQLTSLPDQG